MQVATSAGRSEAEFQLPLRLEDALQRLQVALAGQRRFKLVEVGNRDVQLSARPNWAAWGARVAIRFAPLGESSVVVRTRWEPALSTTVLTWGQGHRDIEAVAQLLSS